MTKQKKKMVGRNDPCPCGSGVKYKKCHGTLSAKPASPPPMNIKAILESHEAKEALRQNQQGRGNPIISAESQGYRFTVVGNQLHYGETHKTFIDFLAHYIRNVLDPEWGNAEIAKPLEERHQILRWYDAICELQQENMKKPKGEIQAMPVTGVVAAYYSLAYNLYLLQHNAELQEYLIRRLKQPESFYPAYYETFVSAWFILAGFEIHLEDEEDPSRTHPEFIATRSDESYTVEAKARTPDKEHFDIGNQLYKALRKESHHPRVVFIDMNVGINTDLDAFGNEALDAIRSREPILKIDGEPAPSAHVYVTNRPYHLALNETHLPHACLVAGFKIPDFGHCAKFSSYTEAHKARIKYAALDDVRKAIVNYQIPITFDGEIPEFAFGEAERRFTIGGDLEVADGVSMTLQSGIVMEHEKKACLVLTDGNGQSHIFNINLSDAEVTAYRAHPETFFGRIVPVSKNVEDPLDLFEFFVNGYKETPRERLLELMSGAPNIEKLKKLPDDELLYVYAEGLTHSTVQKRE